MPTSAPTQPLPALDLPQKLVPLLLRWYGENARDLPWRQNRDPYRVWVSEIMLQQTQVQTVVPYFLRFTSAAPTVFALAQLPDAGLLKLWEGLGYYSRARNLKKAAAVIVSKHGGVFPSRYDDILALPGVGRYTAGAIASICFDLPTPAVDGNVLRLVSRLTACYDDVALPATKRRVEEALRAVYPKTHSGAFTQALMELGATVCLPNTVPDCPRCPVRSLCQAYKDGCASGLPVRQKRAERQIEDRTVWILSCGDQVAVCRREDAGLLAGLWQLPNSLGSLSGAEAARQAEDWDVHPLQLTKSLHRSHIFTHIRWDMTCYYLTCAVQSGRFVWIDPAGSPTHPLPSAFKKLLERD